MCRVFSMLCPSYKLEYHSCLSCVSVLLGGYPGGTNGGDGGIVICSQAHEIIMCLYNFCNCYVPVEE
jgi:hypothetical protein